jgi:hypothetical protein
MTLKGKSRTRLIGSPVRRTIFSAALAAVVVAGTETASAQVYSPDPVSEAPALTVVAAGPAAATNSAPIVLRGSRPAPQAPNEEGATPVGSFDQPGYGSTGEPNDDYGDWPYFGPDGGFSGGGRHGFRRRFAGHEFPQGSARLAR